MSLDASARREIHDARAIISRLNTSAQGAQFTLQQVFGVLLRMTDQLQRLAAQADDLEDRQKLETASRQAETALELIAAVQESSSRAFGALDGLCGALNGGLDGYRTLDRH